MEIFRSHPLLTLAAGIVIGLVFGPKLKQLPGVNKLPMA
jgi:hypothetical protein